MSKQKEECIVLDFCAHKLRKEKAIEDSKKEEMTEEEFNHKFMQNSLKKAFGVKAMVFFNKNTK